MMDRDSLARIAFSVASGGSVRTAGRVEFVKDTGPVRRDVRAEGFEWSPDALRNLSKILWAAQRSHSYAVAALRLLSKMPSSKFSPDGLLGGRGYIQSVKDMRSGLSSAVEVVSAFTDTLYDEVNADHWSSVESGSEDLLEETEEIKQNPEKFVDDEFREDEGSEFQEDDQEVSQDPDDLNPTPQDFGQSDEDEESDEDEDEESDGFPRTSGTISDVSTPEWKDADIVSSLEKKVEEMGPDDPGSRLPSDSKSQSESLSDSEAVMRTTTPSSGNFAPAVAALVRSQRIKVGTSSLPVDAVPGGPRVVHIEPGSTENGFCNGPDAVPSDDPGYDGLSSGVNVTKPVYEGHDELTDNDGVTGYDGPSGGASFVSAEMQHYSWLPGTTNEKNLGYYDRNLSDDDVEWMRANSAPDNPMAPAVKPRSDTSWLWEA